MAAGVCVTAADDIFDQDDEGIVVLLCDPVPADNENVARNAARMCPSGALRIVTD